MSILVWNMLLAASLAGAVDAELQKLDGSMHLGRIVSVSSEEVVLETSAGEVRLPAREVFSVEILASEFVEDFDVEEEAQIELVDGSLLRAASFRVEASRAKIETAAGAEILAPTRSIRSVRFRKESAKLQQQWQAIEKAEHSGDVLVLRKTSSTVDANGLEQVTAVLDTLEGALYDINDETVGFDFNGTRFDVSLDKVAGVIYLARSSARAAEPVCQLVERKGSVWNLKSLKMSDGMLTGVTAGGVRLAVPLAELAKLDYSIGNLVFLSDLEPESVEWTPTLQTRSTPSSVKKFYEPQRDRGFFGAPLSVAGQSYQKGLSIHSRTVMQYRLTSEFRRFAAVAGLDSRFRATGNVTLKIQGDGKTLLTQKIADSEAAVPIDLDIQDVRRLIVTVDFGDDNSDIGDYLNLCNARLLK